MECSRTLPLCSGNECVKVEFGKIESNFGLTLERGQYNGFNSYEDKVVFVMGSGAEPSKGLAVLSVHREAISKQRDTEDVVDEMRSLLEPANMIDELRSQLCSAEVTVGC